MHFSIDFSEQGFGNNITENGWAGITVDSCEQVSVFNTILQEMENTEPSRRPRGIILRWKGNFEVYNTT